MKALFLIILLASAFPLVAQTDAEVAARADVLELAGAFANDGFKLRDGHHTAMLESATPRLLVVNLYAGNDYWFMAGTGTNDGEIKMEVFDSEGLPLTVEPYTAPGRAAAGLSPIRSGRHFIRILLPSGDPVPVSFLYSYR